MKLIEEVLVVVIAKSKTPLPVINVVTSALTHVQEAKFPEEPITAPVAGALAYVSGFSSQTLELTLRT